MLETGQKGSELDDVGYMVGSMSRFEACLQVVVTGFGLSTLGTPVDVEVEVYHSGREGWQDTDAECDDRDCTHHTP